MTKRSVGTGLGILANFLMFHHVGLAQQPSRVEDPFATHELTSSSSGKAYPRELDPCLEKLRPTAWTLLDVVNQALCHNPQTRTASMPVCRRLRSGWASLQTCRHSRSIRQLRRAKT